MQASDIDEAFMSASVPFLEAVATEYQEVLPAARDSLALPTRPLAPLVLSNIVPSRDEIEALKTNYFGADGVAAFSLPTIEGAGRHALLDFAEALAADFPTRHPVSHPMESHPEARARFGIPDGTLKIYDLPLPVGGVRYREQAETNEAFEAHSDGLGYAGLIATAALVADSAPLWGGYTIFSNVVRLSAALALEDPEAFRALFLPDAITCIRPRGKGAIKVSGPVLYLAPGGKPRVFLRVGSGEYQVTWRADNAPLQRGRVWCQSLATPFANGSTFVHLVKPGEGVLIRNQHVVHSRTPFLDSPLTSRVLARKWFVEKSEHAGYRHAPGLSLDSRWASLLPDRFDDAQTSGDWHYDPETDQNIRAADCLSTGC